MVKRKGELAPDFGWSTPNEVTVCGSDLPTGFRGKTALWGMALLLTAHRKPRPQRSRVFDAIVIALVEHGLNGLGTAPVSTMKKF